MAKLNIDQRTIIDLFQDKRSDFLIPDYQRPYAWGENECQTLWDDIFNFAIPENGRVKFDRNNEYFLGPIVTFKNSDGKIEVIDGQQRLTTLMLLLRAFYNKFIPLQDEDSMETKRSIERCLWKTDEMNKPDKDQLKIDSEVATDKDKEEFLDILCTGNAENGQKSRYAINFRFFQERISDFSKEFPIYLAYLPTRIMNNCILLPIEAESQDTALRIFSTLNDRGKPLSDADIFKAQFYKFYSSIGQKDDFIRQWKEIEELCSRIFHPIAGTPMDELFTRYMYFVRAKNNIKSSTTEALRKFYEKDNYNLLKREETFDELTVLAHFWEDVSNQDSDRFSQRILRRLFVLNYAPNSMWTYFVSVYFMQNKDDDGMLDDDDFYSFLNKTIGFIWAYAITNPGITALRTPIYAEMVNVVNNQPVTFSDFKFDLAKLKNMFSAFTFNNARPITKAMLTWWAFQDDNQDLLSLETIFEIEHIYPRSRQDKEKSLKDSRNLDSLGNKALLEKRINIRAADYRFADKKRYYNGFTNSRNQKKEGTKIHELTVLANTVSDFTETDIKSRSKAIMNAFFDFLNENELTMRGRKLN